MNEYIKDIEEKILNRIYSNLNEINDYTPTLQIKDLCQATNDLSMTLVNLEKYKDLIVKGEIKIDKNGKPIVNWFDKAEKR